MVEEVDYNIDQNGIDEALLGPWVLQSQTVSTGDGTVTNPFSGRVTSFSVGTFDLEDDLGNVTTVADLQFSENYSSESADDADGCTVSGTSGGSWSVVTTTNFDDPTYPLIYELEVYTNPTNPTNPTKTAIQITPIP